MTDSSSEALPASDVRPRWRDNHGKLVTVHALSGSYADRRIQTELHDAEEVAEALVKLLEPPADRRGEPVDIYLTDPVTAAPGVPPQPNGHDAVPASGTAIIRIVQPEAPGEPVALPLTRTLIARWFGANAASSALFVDGIAGVVAARTGSGPSIQDAQDWVRAQLTAGQSISVFSQMSTQQPPSAASQANPPENRIATAFIAYLLETYGAAALRQFLAAYDPSRQDQATLDAFQRPLGALEETWLAGMAHAPGRSSAIRSFLQYLLPLLKPYWRQEIEVLVYILFNLSYGLLLPLSGKYLVDTVIPSGNLNTLAIFIGILFVIYLINGVVGTRRAYVNAEINQRLGIELQERMFTHLQHLSHNFYAEAKVGDIVSRFTSDLQIVQSAMTQVISIGIFMALTAVVAAVTLLTLSPLLGALVIIVVPIFVASYLALRSHLEQASLERQELLGDAVSSLQENLSAHAVVKAFSLQVRSIRAYHARLVALLKSALRLTLIASLFEASSALAITFGQIIVLGVGSYLVIQGYMTVGTLIAFIGLLPSMISPLAVLSGVGQTVQAASGSISRITELLETPVEVDDRPGAVALPPLSQAIRLDHVTFNYGGDRPILSDLSMTIPAGANIAIVGPSGSGKSTVINLLLRFWDPEQGQVLFDDHDLRDVTLDSLREQIGIVFQDTFIFDTSLRENIAIGRPGATDAEIAAAAKAAQLDSYISTLPAGYNTVLGERGVRMSGGQRQRLAIARALLRDPRILILDEATSALDAQTEREILDTLAQVAQGRTTVSITHRLSIAAAADLIFVLNQGRLVEHGTHAELVQTAGLYRQLYEEQTGYATAGGQTRVGVEIARLREVPIFAGLSGEAMAALSRRLTLERYPANYDVVRQGEPGDRLYIISRGQAEVLVEDGHETRRLNVLNPGDYFGEMALLEGRPRNATVRTTQPSELYSLQQGDFVDLLDSDAALRQGISETIAMRHAALTAAGVSG